MSDNRLEHLVTIPLGHVLKSKEGLDYIFIGWTVNTAGCVARFIRSMDGSHYYSQPWFYNVSYLHTALEKFPSLKELVNHEKKHELQS